MTWVINIFGGPGIGKSTVAAELFSEMKKKGYSCELVDEFAKGLVWDASKDDIANQVYCLGNQYHKINRLKDKVDYIITDSPILLNNVYADKTGYGSENFKGLVRELNNRFYNLDVVLKRDTSSFETNGRIHDEKTALELDSLIKKELEIVTGVTEDKWSSDIPFLGMDNHIILTDRDKACYLVLNHNCLKLNKENSKYGK